MGAVGSLGLDETLFGLRGNRRTRSWCTSIVDVAEGQLLGIVPGRTAASTKCAAESTTTRSAPGAARTTRCIGRGGYSFPPTNVSPTQRRPDSAACSPPATPTARSYETSSSRMERKEPSACL